MKHEQNTDPKSVDNSEQKSKKRFTSRRRMLQSVGLVATGTFGVVGSATARSRNRIVFLQGSLENPISKGEIVETKRQVRENVDANPRFRSDPVRSDVTALDEDGEETDEEAPGKIVNFVFTIAEDGVPQGYTGVAREPADLSIVRRRAAMQQARLRKGKKIKTGVEGGSDNPLDLTEASPGSGSGMSSFDSGVSTAATPSFVEIGRNSKDDYRKPFGGLQCSYVFYKLASDGNSSRDYYALKHTYAIDPGSRAYSGDLATEYYNDTALPTHDWKNTQLSSPQLADWDPLGNREGSTTVGVSLGAGSGGPNASLGWSYTSPAVLTEDITKPDVELANWRQGYYFNLLNTKPRTQLGGMKPGSSGQFQQPSSGSGQKRVCNCASRGKFRDFVTGFLTSEWSTGYNLSYVY